MSDWDVASEKPAPKGDWEVASETPANKPKEKLKRPFISPKAKEITGDVAEAIGKYGPDVLKSAGSGLAEGTIGLVTGPIDLGARAGGYAVNKAMDAYRGYPLPHEYMPSLTESVTKALGLEHDPTTTPGEVTKFASSFVPGLGTVTGKAASLGGKGLQKAEDFLYAPKNIKTPVANETTQAIQTIVKRLQEAHKAGGPSPQEVLEKLKAARAAGKPMTLSDFGGEGVKSLGGYVARQPGAARDLARGFLTKRDAEAAKRLTDDIDEHIAAGSVRKAIKEVTDARSKQAGPLFEEAYKGGSIAPLEKQYETHFNTAAKTVNEASAEISKLLNKSTQLKAKLATTKDTYVFAETSKAIRENEQAIAAKEAELAQASADKASTLAHLRQTQIDKTTNAPGAVWSPGIQRRINNPIVKQGIAQGLKIERNLADAEGRPFNPYEYAIVGEKNGEPVVARVPNMRLLAAAKEGLDSILSSPEMRDRFTGRLTKDGRSVDKLRRALIQDLDAANPKYKEARDVWAGHSASISAADFGSKLFNNKPEDIAAEIAEMSPSEKEFARLGAADVIRERVLKTGMGGDEAKAIIKNDWTKAQLRPLFKSDTEFNHFVNSVLNERTMFETKQAIMGGSQTAERVAEDKANNATLGLHAAKGLTKLATGAYWSSLATLIKIRSELGLRQNPKLNEEIAKMLFSPDADLSALASVKK